MQAQTVEVIQQYILNTKAYVKVRQARSKPQDSPNSPNSEKARQGRGKVTQAKIKTKTKQEYILYTRNKRLEHKVLR